MRVLKFGGTSVGKPQRMHEVAQLINDGHTKIVVLSAVSGTTNSLVALANSFQLGKDQQALQQIGTLEAHYEAFVQELYSSESALAKAQNLLSEKFSLLRKFSSESFTDSDELIILAQGELISTHLFHFYCEEQGIETVLLPALEFMRTEKGEPDLRFIAKALANTLRSHLSSKLYITQGYICRNEFGQIGNLQRGGSDYSASLIGAAIAAEEIQIWTDIDGFHNNDPRFVKPTYPIEKLSFDEAAELAYFGAKILHPASVLPAQKANIPVRLKNTMEPEAKGTIISLETNATKNKVKAVAAKDGITAIRIRSSRMLLAYGFLKKVFEVFEKHKTPIDMITTSEVAVSLTIDDDRHLAAIEKELKKYAHIEIENQQTIVCVVGEFTHEEPGLVLQVLECLRDVPLRMISSGGSEHNVSVLVNTDLKQKVLQALNEGLFLPNKVEV
ncbi:MAG: aspartate kinase [Bacteroidota bacterium]